MALVVTFPLLAWVGVWGYRTIERRSALEMARTGPFAAAAPLLQAQLARSPDDLELLQALCRGYASESDGTPAGPWLDRWCLLEPNRAEPFRLRMDFLRKERRSSQALQDGLRLLQLEPDNSELAVSVAGFAFSSGDFVAAEKHCRDALTRQPKRRDARRLLAEILRARAQFTEASQLLEALYNEKPDDTAVLMGRGSLLVEMGKPDEAIPLLEVVIRLDPRRQRTARYQLAIAYERAGRPADARRVQAELAALQEAEVLSDALDHQPNNPDVQARAARAWLAAGQTAKGLELIGRVLDRFPDHREAHAVLADYYDRVGQTGRAAEHRRRAAAPR